MKQDTITQSLDYLVQRLSLPRLCHYYGNVCKNQSNNLHIENF